MYNPQKYKESDLNEAFDLMDHYLFATVVTVHDGKPFISHLPLTPIKTPDGIELVGHLAKANPHWKLLTNGSTTIIFQGAHTYITPKWYAEDDVPTWNYSVVHTSGRTTLIEDYEGLVECLKTLTSHAERHWPSGWNFFIPDDLKGPDLPKHIVGFRMKIDDINFKRKLSQNRTPADRAGVLRGLGTRTDDASRSVLSDMLQLYGETGENK